MATRAELDQIRLALARLSDAAQADWQYVWDSLRASDRVVVGRAMAQGWMWVLQRYGDMAATLAADYFEVQALDLGVKPKVVLAPGMDESRAVPRLGWAISTQESVANSLGLLDELVRQPYRSTFQDSAWKSGAGWARVPSGATTCAFCLMLASRGAVYGSEQLASLGVKGKKYHGHCDCTPTLVRGPQDFPEGYDPTGLYDQYDAARREAGSGDPKAILAALRQQQGTN